MTVAAQIPGPTVTVGYDHWQGEDMREPQFFFRDVSDEELRADLIALRTNQYPQWRLIGDAAYETGQATGDAIVVRTFERIWLDYLGSRAGRRAVVTLQRLGDRGVWHRIAGPGQDLA